MDDWLTPEQAIREFEIDDLVWCEDKHSDAIEPGRVYSLNRFYPTVLLIGSDQPVDFFCFYKLKKIELPELP